MNQKEKFSKVDGAKKIDESQYRSLIGCLMYFTATRPDIMFVVSLLSRFMHCAGDVHFQAAKRIVIYIKGTTHIKALNILAVRILSLLVFLKVIGQGLLMI